MSSIRMIHVGPKRHLGMNDVAVRRNGDVHIRQGNKLGAKLGTARKRGSGGFVAQDAGGTYSTWHPMQTAAVRELVDRFNDDDGRPTPTDCMYP